MQMGSISVPEHVVTVSEAWLTLVTLWSLKSLCGLMSQH